MKKIHGSIKVCYIIKHIFNNNVLQRMNQVFCIDYYRLTAIKTPIDFMYV